MDLQSAAKYMVVAWVKDWSLATYIGTVSPGTSAAAAHTAFPWLPADQGWWRDENGECATVRRFMQQAFPVTNARLWEAADVSGRIAVHAEIMRLICGQIAPLPSSGLERQYRHDALRDQTNLLGKLSQETFERMGRRHWLVCK
jgi:hypothetical protein